MFVQPNLMCSNFHHCCAVCITVLQRDWIIFSRKLYTVYHVIYTSPLRCDVQYRTVNIFDCIGSLCGLLAIWWCNIIPRWWSFTNAGGCRHFDLWTYGVWLRGSATIWYNPTMYRVSCITDLWTGYVQCGWPFIGLYMWILWHERRPMCRIPRICA